MRKILFRGKLRNRSGWLYGNLIIDRFETHDGSGNTDGGKTGLIVSISNRSGSMEVIPETVGQYTGLKDKNGKRIFEGDVVELTHTLGEETGVIKWAKKECAFMLVKKTGSLRSLAHVSELPECVKVVGNIHDNPELLEGKDDGR